MRADNTVNGRVEEIKTNNHKSEIDNSNRNRYIHSRKAPYVRKLIYEFMATYAFFFQLVWWAKLKIKQAVQKAIKVILCREMGKIVSGMR